MCVRLIVGFYGIVSFFFAVLLLLFCVPALKYFFSSVVAAAFSFSSDILQYIYEYIYICVHVSFFSVLRVISSCIPEKRQHFCFS